jgi:hypothetical protein
VSPHHRDEDPDEGAAGARGEAPDAAADEELVDGPESEGDTAHVPDPERPEAGDSDDLLWQQIVDNYGDRPQWVDPPSRRHPDHPAGSRRRPPTPPPPPETASSQADPAEGEDLQRGPDERFRPPPPPPVPWARPPRLVAWFGIFGVPVLVLLALILRVELPSWLGVVLMFWFVGGFGYLVASMRPHGEDPDDGAVV